MSQKNKIHQRKAFTLAEILITLAIIGVVAAMTIPTMIKNYQKSQTVEQLKKTYTSLSQATQLAITENGSIDNWALGANATGAAAVAFADTYMLPYLKISTNCGTSTTGSCGHKISYSNNPSSDIGAGANGTRFYLSDGTLIELSVYNLPAANGKYVSIYVDVDGQKGKNMLGRDIFRYNYMLIYNSDTSKNGKFLPNGFNVSQNRTTLMNFTGTRGCKVNGEFCEAVIMLDDWQIKTDYPW